MRDLKEMKENIIRDGISGVRFGDLRATQRVINVG